MTLPAINLRSKILLAAIVVISAGGVFFILNFQKERPASNLSADQCRQAEGKERYRCYEQYFTQLTQDQDARQSLEELDRLSRDDKYVESQCHPLVHVIGRTAFKKYEDLTKAAGQATEICWSGYYHGIMEAYMADFDDSQLLAKMPAICESDPSKPYSFAYYNCLHGLGHGLTIRFENDIFRSLPYCEAIGKQWESWSCYGGVFMQNIVTDGDNHVSVNLKAEDLVYPCNAIKDDQKEQCFLMQTSYILKALNYDYPQAFAVCDGVETAYIATCYQSMGRDISGNFLLAPAKVIQYCELGQPAYRGECYVGAAKNAVFNDHGTANATRLCQAVNQEYKRVCAAARDEAAVTL